MLVLGFGIALAVVWPNKAISLTTNNEQLRPPKTEIAYIEAPSQQQIEELYTQWKTTKVSTNNFCSCVLFVEGLTGNVVTSIGAARNWPINSQIPVVGGVVVTSESFPGTNTGHVAFILSVGPESIEVVEANFVHCKKTTRTIKLNDPAIKGFWVN